MLAKTMAGEGFKMDKQEAIQLAVKNAARAQRNLDGGAREWGLAFAELSRVWLEVSDRLPAATPPGKAGPMAGEGCWFDCVDAKVAP